MTLPLLLVAVLASPVQMTPVLALGAAAGPVEVAQDAPDPPVCAAQVQWMNDTQLIVSRTAARPLTFFAAVGHGYCNAEVVFSVVYFDAADEVVCSGFAELRIPHASSTPYQHIEVRPGNVYEFIRWRNGPRATSQQWSRLNCVSPDGQTEVQPAELDRAQSMRLHVAVVPRNNGLATAELRMLLRP